MLTRLRHLPLFPFPHLPHTCVCYGYPHPVAPTTVRLLPHHDVAGWLRVTVDSFPFAFTIYTCLYIAGWTFLDLAPVVTPLIPVAILIYVAFTGYGLRVVGSTPPPYIGRIITTLRIFFTRCPRIYIRCRRMVYFVIRHHVTPPHLFTLLRISFVWLQLLTIYLPRYSLCGYRYATYDTVPTRSPPVYALRCVVPTYLPRYLSVICWIYGYLPHYHVGPAVCWVDVLPHTHHLP